MGNQFFFDNQVFLPSVVAVLFNFDLIFSRSKIDGVVGGGGKVMIEVNLGAFGKRVGGEKAGGFGKAVFGGSITLGPTNGEVSADGNKNGGGNENQEMEFLLLFE